MSAKIDRKSNTMTISSFHEGFVLKKYNMDPDYQRKSVWSEEQQSLLIDSILKNIPIPPIFLRESIDKEGRTKYEVIDGKQRLLSIINFINGNIATSDDIDDPLHDFITSGVTFDTLKSDEIYDDYLDDFWSYPIPVEYIKTKDDSIIDRIFDRLNRSGEKLTGQELRNANYYNSKLIQLSYKLSKDKYLSNLLVSTDKKRMEDIQLISEFIFILIEDKELNSTNKDLDELYKKYARNNKDVDWNEINEKFISIINLMIYLDLDFNSYGISGVSHLYGIWSFCHYCIKNKLDKDLIKNKINEFYSVYKAKDYLAASPQSEYKKTMQYNTRGSTQRKKRREALVSYCIQ